MSTLKYELLQKTSLNQYMIDSIAVYFLTDYQIAKNKELLSLVKYKKWTQNLGNQLLKFKRFTYIKNPVYFKNTYQLTDKVRGLNDYDDQFIWLHETNQIGCNVMNYYKLVTKSGGYKINTYLANKKCDCWKGTLYTSNKIINNYIKLNNSIGLRTYFDNHYNIYRPDWNEYLYFCKFYDVDEEIKDMIKMRM